MKTVVCLKCNRTSFAVTREHAEAEVKRFNEYFDTLDENEQHDYYSGRRSSISNYVCIYCGGSRFKPGNTAPDGSTLNPVIYEEKT
jgi:hypothetical protein